MRDRLLLACLVGFVLGILARSFFDFGFAFGLFLLVVAGALYLSGNIAPLSRPPRRTGQGRSLLPVFVFALALGMLRFDVSELHKNNPILDSHLNERVTLLGKVVDEPDERENSMRLTVALDSLVTGDKKFTVAARALVVSDLYPKFRYGDRLLFTGRLAKPKNFADPSGEIFDYRSYLAKEGVYYQITSPKIQPVAFGQGNFIMAKLFDLKQSFLERVSANLAEPQTSLLGGLLVGAKRSLGQKLLDDFRRAGVIHIVVLSGYNITIIAAFIERLFSRFRRNLRLILASTGIILFAVMVGASATVVRATVMALLVILARATGRPYDITRALLLAGFLMVLQNPKILVFDSSFQLSFMSTLALIYVSPMLEKYFTFVTEKFSLRSVAVATLATQIFVLPMLLYKMGELSLVALPVNLLILSAIPATMLFGFLAGAVGFLSTALALPFALVAYGLLSYELQVVAFFSHLPFASVAVKDFPLWFVVFLYLFYFVIFLRFRPPQARRVRV
ncbi:MAG: ComEC family competence protein [Candidatus Taylorbacteria bacterium]|nr:ComEC family competence protein [Candidatus Taylorbacteria bacterium]